MPQGRKVGDDVVGGGRVSVDVIPTCNERKPGVGMVL